MSDSSSGAQCQIANYFATLFICLASVRKARSFKLCTSSSDTIAAATDTVLSTSAGNSSKNGLKVVVIFGEGVAFP